MSSAAHGYEPTREAAMAPLLLILTSSGRRPEAYKHAWEDDNGPANAGLLL
jgi:hypothetical protein